MKKALALIATSLFLSACLRSAPTPPTTPPPDLPADSQLLELTGVVNKGIDLDIQHCQTGLYFQYQDSWLLLKTLKNGIKTMIDDESIIHQEVQLTGYYPAQDFFCEALTCDCEDYILVTDIKAL